MLDVGPARHLTCFLPRTSAVGLKLTRIPKGLIATRTCDLLKVFPMQIDSKLDMHLADVMLKDSRRSLSMRSLFRLCAIVLAPLPITSHREGWGAVYYCCLTIAHLIEGTTYEDTHFRTAFVDTVRTFVQIV